MPRSKGPCRLLKDAVVERLFPKIELLGFEKDVNPPHWHGWDASTGSYCWEFRRKSNNNMIDLLMIDLVCSRLIIHIEVAKIEDKSQPNLFGEITKPEELSVILMPSPIRKRLIRRWSFFNILRQYNLRKTKYANMMKERAEKLVSEICEDMFYVRAYFDGNDTKGRIKSR